jgi:hypothetical protein
MIIELAPEGQSYFLLNIFHIWSNQCYACIIDFHNVSTKRMLDNLGSGKMNLSTFCLFWGSCLMTILTCWLFSGAVVTNIDQCNNLTQMCRLQLEKQLHLICKGFFQTSCFLNMLSIFKEDVFLLRLRRQQTKHLPHQFLSIIKIFNSSVWSTHVNQASLHSRSIRSINKYIYISKYQYKWKTHFLIQSFLVCWETFSFYDCFDRHWKLFDIWKILRHLKTSCQFRNFQIQSSI